MLGKRGMNFRIEDGKVGYGEFALCHSIPLTDVATVEVVERAVGESRSYTTVLALGTVPDRGFAARAPKQETEITVRTKDGQEAHWVIQQRGGAWVRDKLAPVLGAAGISIN